MAYDIASFPNIMFNFNKYYPSACVYRKDTLWSICKMRNETRNETCQTERNEMKRTEIY